MLHYQTCRVWNSHPRSYERHVKTRLARSQRRKLQCTSSQTRTMVVMLETTDCRAIRNPYRKAYRPSKTLYVLSLFLEYHMALRA